LICRRSQNVIAFPHGFIGSERSIVRNDQNVSTMKRYYIIIFSLMLLVIAPAKVLGQTSGLITLLPDDNTVLLNADERQALAELQADPLIANIRFVAFNTSALEQTGTTIELPVGESVIFNKTQLESTSYGIIAWTGTPAEDVGMAIIMVSGDSVSGIIDIAGRSYEIMTLGTANYLTMERLMPTEEFESHCEVLVDWSNPFPLEEPTILSTIDKRNVVENNLRVLIAYTPKAAGIAKKKGTTIKRLALASVLYTNQAYQNSEIDNKMEIARLVEVDHTEFSQTASTSDEINWLRDNLDIVALKKTHSADIAVLILGADLLERGAWDGVSLRANLGPKAELGLSCVRIINNWPLQGFMETFAHETGHLMGADHNLQSVGDRYEWPSEPYAHGYYNLAERWNTIMSYPQVPNEVKIPYYSNPDLTHPKTGSPLGDPNCCNNARAINENKNVVKDYRIPDNDLTVSNFNLPAKEIADFNAIDNIQVSDFTAARGSDTGFKAGSGIIFDKSTIIKGTLKASIAPVAGCASRQILTTTREGLTLPPCPGMPVCFEFHCADSYSIKVFDASNFDVPSSWVEVYNGSGTITGGKICVPMDQNVTPYVIYAVLIKARNTFIEQTFQFAIFIDQNMSCPRLTCPTGNCSPRMATEEKPEDQQVVTDSDEAFRSTIHPNPVSNSAIIEYYLPGAAFVSITVFSGMGKQVLKLNDHQLLPEGAHQRNFDISQLTPGVYTYAIQARDKYQAGRFVIVK
jgi:hypothetical protein